MDELAKLLKNCKFAICPYLDATQSGVVQTAFSADVPLIVTNVGSLPISVKNNITGIVIEPSNVDALAEAILYLYTSDIMLYKFRKNINDIWRPSMQWDSIVLNYVNMYKNNVNNMNDNILLSLVTVTYMPEHKMFDDFLTSYRQYNDLGTQAKLFVIDNSPKRSWNVRYFQDKYPEVNFIFNPENPGFGASNNLGASLTNSKYILFINNDVEFCESVFKKIISRVQKIDNFGCATIYAHGGSPSVFQKPDRKHKRNKKFNEQDFYLSGAFLFFDRNAFDKIGKFDDNIFMYFEEYDLSERLLANNFISLYLNTICFVHKTGQRNVSSLSTYKALINSAKYVAYKHKVKFYKSYFLKGPLKFFIYDIINFNFKGAINELKVLGYVMSKIQSFTK